MEITVNKEDKEVREGQDLLSLVQSMNIDQRGIAIALNEQVVPKVNWALTPLSEKDRVTIIRATQGG